MNSLGALGPDSTWIHMLHWDLWPSFHVSLAFTWFHMYLALAPDSICMHMNLGPWPQISYAFICFWDLWLRFHMNSHGLGALGPDSTRIHMMLWNLWPSFQMRPAVIWLHMVLAMAQIPYAFEIERGHLKKGTSEKSVVVRISGQTLIIRKNVRNPAKR